MTLAKLQIIKLLCTFYGSQSILYNNLFSLFSWSLSVPCELLLSNRTFWTFYGIRTVVYHRLLPDIYCCLLFIIKAIKHSKPIHGNQSISYNSSSMFCDSEVYCCFSFQLVLSNLDLLRDPDYNSVLLSLMYIVRERQPVWEGSLHIEGGFRG
jgi:hypothetical protein